MSEARVEWLTVGGSAATWRSLGLVVGPGGQIPFVGAGVRVVEAAEPGMQGWALSAVDPTIGDIDGVPTEVVPASMPAIADHELGAIGLDHVVLLTDSLERTCGAVADATGAPLKRIREVGAMRQGFHRIGPGGLVVEVVERPELAGTGHATMWGFVLDVRDLDAAVAFLGPERIGDPKDAVQPGRRIATVRSSVGLGAAIALMSPHLR
jgi:hypothetical protein